MKIDTLKKWQDTVIALKEERETLYKKIQPFTISANKTDLILREMEEINTELRKANGIIKRITK